MPHCSVNGYWSQIPKNYVGFSELDSGHSRRLDLKLPAHVQVSAQPGNRRHLANNPTAPMTAQKSAFCTHGRRLSRGVESGSVELFELDHCRSCRLDLESPARLDLDFHSAHAGVGFVGASRVAA